MFLDLSLAIPCGEYDSGLPFFKDLSRLVFTKKSGALDDNTSIDQIGDETRTVQPDRCLLGDGSVTITFNASVDQIKYIEPDGTVSAWQAISGAWTIPNTVEIIGIILSDGLSQIGYLPCQEGTGTTLYDVGITTNNNNLNATLSADTVRETTIFEPTWNNWNNWNK
jgi:hypothetical protein